MNWVRVEDRPPALGKMVLVTIHGSDIIQLQPGETLAEAVERARRGFRRVTIGMLDGEEGWIGVDGWPMVVKPVALLLTAAAVILAEEIIKILRRQ